MPIVVGPSVCSDSDRLNLIAQCMENKRLSDAAKLMTINAILNSRKEYSEYDMKRTHELFGSNQK